MDKVKVGSGQIDNGPEALVTGVWEQIIEPEVSDLNRSIARICLRRTVQAYNQPRREHHNLFHIADCLTHLVPYEGREDYSDLALGMLWHDIVHNPKSMNNEEDSVVMAKQMLNAMELHERHSVDRLILSTRSHHADAEDEALVCAIDLSILAAPADRYMAYARDIRREYLHYYRPDEFAEGRLRFLNMMIGAEAIFEHPDFSHLDPAARANMQGEADLLRAA